MSQVPPTPTQPQYPPEDERGTRFNEIVVVDSIPSGEHQTARDLVDDLRSYRAFYRNTPFISDARIESAFELPPLLAHIGENVRAQNARPLLHIECHGSFDGLGFADGSTMTWDELRPALVELNIATALNLVVTVAACVGGALAQTVRLTHRAPFYGLVGPTEDMDPGDLLKAFRAFFLTMMSTSSVHAAMQALVEETRSQPFYRNTARKLFRDIWERYKADSFTPEALAERAERMVRRRSERQPGGTPFTPLEEINLLIAHEPEHFRLAKEHFFMYDLFPDNARRFQVEYQR